MRRWLPLLAVCLGTFMLLIDVTIVNVALPDMVGDLHASFGSLQWVVDAYALALAALVLGTGSVADLVGHRRAYVAGLVVFAASSLACGVAPGPTALIAARTVQGIGAAAMFATTFALLNRSYSGRDRGTAYGLWGAVSGASAAVGPIIGGLLTQGASWRWIFFVNLPVSVVAIVLSVVVFGDAGEPATGGPAVGGPATGGPATGGPAVGGPAGSRPAMGRRGVDVPGILTFTAAAGCATYALIRANENGWSSAATWWTLGLAAVLLVAFVAVESRSRGAMLDLALLRNRSFVGVLIAGLLMTFAAFAAFTYTSIWLQSVLGLSPIEAGLTGLPMSVMSFVVSATAGRRLHGTPPHRVIGGGLLCVGLGDALVALLVHGSAGWPALMPGFAVIGVGVGLVTPILGSVSMSLVPANRGGMAAGAVNTTRQLGFAFGIAALGSAFTVGARGSLSGRGVAGAARVARAVAGGQAPSLRGTVPAAARHALDEAVRAAAVAGVRGTFALAAAVGVVAAFLVLYLMRPDRSSSRTSGRAGEPAGAPEAVTAEPAGERPAGKRQAATVR
ncbi:MFS transporter [Rugosimonospora africana]|uniref:MFS transporter n=1 Tax=Rugosimonospora africana TaxID=556532 RepID=A0A8J3VPA7_9ACTN|nr:MFS transporter [Rugosimonospora africana]GIH13900.1 MFS transporter [Rugosimonospora africana]